MPWALYEHVQSKNYKKTLLNGVDIRLREYFVDMFISRRRRWDISKCIEEYDHMYLEHDFFLDELKKIYQSVHQDDILSQMFFFVLHT